TFQKPVYILGIETSCDDTGAAVVNGRGQLLGEGFYSQAKTSVKFGGVVPTVARKYHEKYIEQAVDEALKESRIHPSQLTAVAATVKPGNTLCLEVGAEYGKKLALEHSLPFIPIHHMEAHTLTVRMANKVEFPFVVLLVSGGHCVLAVSHALDAYEIVGETLDASPGCILDQVARRMKLRNLRGMGEVIGGRAVEMMAEGGDPRAFPFPSPMSHLRDANFSFSGIETHAKSLVKRLEEEKGVEGGRVLDEVGDLCASLQHALVQHLVRRTHRGIRFLDVSARIPPQHRTLVISGGVASNMYLRKSFEKLCDAEGYRLLIPAPKLCTDNGVMIAWNGLERWRAGKGVLYGEHHINSVTVEHK
ncbi:UNVERIFIED_CONTAM: hypothetical protein GTU68_028545, partial [Idotea baltica]|nr:hypothetical protein [Idotea baltica]